MRRIECGRERASYQRWLPHADRDTGSVGCWFLHEWPLAARKTAASSIPDFLRWLIPPREPFIDSVCICITHTWNARAGKSTFQCTDRNLELCACRNVPIESFRFTAAAFFFLSFFILGYIFCVTYRPNETRRLINPPTLEPCNICTSYLFFFNLFIYF